MNSIIVDVAQGVTVLGAGETTAAVLDGALMHAPVLVAADGGAHLALDRGLSPVAVIGDGDSFAPSCHGRLPPGRVHLIAEQETTDFDKCLRSIRAPFALAVGFTGARLDHELAAFNALLRHDAYPVILIGATDLAFVAPLSLVLDLAPGTRLSLFPFGPVRGESAGLRWPIGGIGFAPAGRIGTSNEVVAGPVRLGFDAARMLVILPREALAVVIGALSSSGR